MKILPPPLRSALGDKKESETNRKIYTPNNFGIFKESLDIYKKIIHLDITNKKTAINHALILMEMVADGYMQFNKEKKVTCYTNAKSNATKLWAILEIEPGEQSKEISLLLVSKVIPGLSGTIRKIENKDKTK